MKIEENKKALEEIYDESRGATLKELNAIKHVGINDEKDTVVLIVETLEKSSKAEDLLKRKIAKVIKIDLGFSGVRIQFEEAKDASKALKNVILIAGLEGGAGKSTFTINLAYSLKKAGKKVAIIDADIYGASIANMLKATDSGLNVNSANKIIPPIYDNMQIMSIDFFSEPTEPLMWRGEMLSSMINNYLFQVEWDKDTDYTLIDMPSTTGDTLLDVASYVPSASAIILSTEDRNGAHLSYKTYKAIKELNLDLIGFVVNKYTGCKDAPNYLFENCKDSEVLAEIKLSNLDDNYTIKDEDAKKVYDDIASIIMIR